MDEIKLFSWKTFAFLILLILIVVTVSFIKFQDPRTIVVFCDVGQGDGAYIRVRNKIDILVDAGPDNKILSCLSQYMPFWDHTIELAFLSHPQKDHYGGYLSILDHYKIDHFFTTPVTVKSSTFQKLLDKLKVGKTRIEAIYRGTSLEIDAARIDFLWPSKDYVLTTFKPQMDLNNISQIFVFSEGKTHILFTGDIYGRLVEQLIPRVSILKVPHHGSHNGLTKKFLILADPDQAVISVGKHNSYGHPAKSALDMLQALGTKIRRTDIEGTIVFKLQ